MTWKNVLNRVPSVKKSEFISTIFNVISYCNIKWMYHCRGKSLKRCIPTCSPCLFFV